MAKENQILKALETLGFEASGGISYGIYKGYAMDMSPSDGYYTLRIAAKAPSTDKALKKELKADISQAGAPMSLSEISEDGISFIMRLNKKSPYEQQEAVILDAAVSILRSRGFAPMDACAICGGGSPDSLCLAPNFRPVHSACIKNMHEHTKDSIEHNEQNGSYLTGILGAILGALVGLVPSILTAFLLDKIYAILFAVVPIASMWLYKKFNGKNNKASIVIIVILSLLSVFVLQFMIVGIAFRDEYNISYGQAMAVVMEVFLNLDGFVFVVKNSLVELFFMLLGIMFSWQYICRTGAAVLKDSEYLVSTLRPNPAYGGFSSCSCDECSSEASDTPET